MANPDPELSNLLKWGIENSSITTTDDPSAKPPTRPLDPKTLAALFGGPSDADLMKQSMAAILSPDIDLENKLVAFDNFEQLIENLDNANNMGALELWTPLIGLLDHEEKDLRRMAAWCVGTAVQNNPQSQERAMVSGALPKLAALAKSEDQQLRRKACYAISSEIRNYQPGMDAMVKALGGGKKIDASDMDAVDELMSRLRG